MRTPGSNARPDHPLAVVIGAGGIGSAVARRLGVDHRLLLVDRDAGRLAAIRDALAGEGHDVAIQICDITDEGQVTALADTAAAAGPLRTLAHVAALSPSMGNWQTILRVNLIGAALMERAMLPLAGQGTAAIFVSSIAGHGFEPDERVVALLDDPLAPGLIAALDDLVGAEASSPLAYRLSKFAMNRMARRRANAWGRQGARIVSLSPGLIATPMGALEYAGSPGKMALYEAIPLQREGTMIEIAETLAFLASDRAGFINGTDLLVDGGLAAVQRFPG
jgi:NAD(P)-dependent dehydrogenase (short-subunit alcohol dehydrogenase family)